MRLAVSALLVVLLFASCTSLDADVIKEQVFAADEEVFFYMYTLQENQTRFSDVSATRGFDMYDVEVDRASEFAYMEHRDAEGLEKYLFANDQLYRPTNFGTWFESMGQSSAEAFDIYRQVLSRIELPSWNKVSSVRLHGVDAIRIDAAYLPDPLGQEGKQSVWVNAETYRLMYYEAATQLVEDDEVVLVTQIKITFNDVNDRSASKQDELLRQLP